RPRRARRTARAPEPPGRETLASRTTAEWEERLTEAEIPHGPILGVYDALTSDYARTSGILVGMDHPNAAAPDVVASPVRVDGVHSSGAGGRVAPSPALGGNTAEVLRDVLGVDEDRIAELLETSAFVQAEPTEPITE